MRSETDFATNLVDGEASELTFAEEHNKTLVGALAKNPDDFGVDLLYVCESFKRVPKVEVKSCFSHRAPIAAGRKKNFIMQATKKSGVLGGCLSSNSDFFIKHMAATQQNHTCIFGGAPIIVLIPPRTYYFRTIEIRTRFYDLIRSRRYTKTILVQNGRKTKKVTYTIPIWEFEDLDIGRAAFDLSLHALSQNE